MKTSLVVHLKLGVVIISRLMLWYWTSAGVLCKGWFSACKLQHSWGQGNRMNIKKGKQKN